MAAAGGGRRDPLAGRRGMPGEPSGFGRSAAQHVGPDFEVVPSASLHPAGEVDGVTHSLAVVRVVVFRHRSTRRNIAVRLLAQLFIDDRLVGRVGPLEGQCSSTGSPLTLGPCRGPSLREFVVVPVDHAHPL
ncbi:MAG TPA: hypothetical protein VFW57_01235 [Acidimicrobiia bacterium]|nr:hypothetical protein [Acidimicrobiia bacterium]